MTNAKHLDRVIELWPSLPDAARKTIVEIAEGATTRTQDLELSSAEVRQLERAREDFKCGRVLDAEVYKAEIDAYMRSLARE